MARVLEVRPDLGASIFRLLIVFCAFFAVLLNTVFVLMALKPDRATPVNRPQNAEPQDNSFMFVIGVIFNVGLVGAICGYLIAKKKQRESPPLIRIDDEAIQFGAELEASIPWSSVNAVGERIVREQNVVKEAQLVLNLVDGQRKTVELKSLQHKPEKIVGFAKEAHRTSRGIKVRDLKDFAASITCPICGQTTLSLKQIQSGMIVFFFVHNHYSLKQYTCCRRCVARILAKDSAINLLTCHITWPILWLGAVIMPQVGKLILSGHDEKALREVT